jgi:phosphate transport system substrate-binding protein
LPQVNALSLQPGLSNQRNNNRGPEIVTVSLIGARRYFVTFRTHQHVARRLMCGAALVCGLRAAPVAAAEDQASLTIGGTGGEFATMRLLGDAFHEANPAIRVTVLVGLGDTGGINATLAGAVDVGTTSRPLSGQERDKGAAATEYGRTPLVFAVGPTTPGTKISTVQLTGIYTGRLDKWPNGTRARPVLRSESDNVTLILKQQLPAIAEAITAAGQRHGMQFALTDQDCAIAIANVPGAIGPMTLSYIRAAGLPLRPLALDGVTPNIQTIADGSYSTYETLYLITGPGPTPPARKFLTFVASTAGWKILVETAHWVPDRTNPE